MKKRKFIGGLLALIFGVGCQSGGHHASRNSFAPSPGSGPAYSVKLIPISQLAPTSREGDRFKVLYSSNIVAVYANTNRLNAGMTDPSVGVKRAGTTGR